MTDTSDNTTSDESQLDIDIPWELNGVRIDTWENFNDGTIWLELSTLPRKMFSARTERWMRAHSHGHYELTHVAPTAVTIRTDDDGLAAAMQLVRRLCAVAQPYDGHAPTEAELERDADANVYRLAVIGAMAVRSGDQLRKAA